MIGKARQDRLWGHLMEVEKQVGKPLRTTPRDDECDCPMFAFAPIGDRELGVFYGASSGRISYANFKTKTIWSWVSSGDWWRKLPPETRLEVTNWLSKKLKERASNG